MTSGAEAEAHLPGVAGLAFLGFPLHPPGAPADTRGEHLSDVSIPMLFLQGTKDEFAELDLLEPLVKRLGRRATLHRVEAADHSFHVPAKSGRKDAEVLDEVLDAMAAWVEGLA
jgi:predicted alpha/beta-hydrolase family hydrolase